MAEPRVTEVSLSLARCHCRIRCNRIFQYGSKSLNALLFVITQQGRRVMANHHAAGSPSPRRNVPDEMGIEFSKSDSMVTAIAVKGIYVYVPSLVKGGFCAEN